MIPPPTVQETVGQITPRTSTVTRCRVDKGWEIPYKNTTYRGGNFVPCAWEGTFVETEKSRRARGVKKRKPAVKPQPRGKKKTRKTAAGPRDLFYPGAYSSGTVAGPEGGLPALAKIAIGVGVGFLASKLLRR